LKKVPTQSTDPTPETAVNLFGEPKKNPIGTTEAEAVRAARAAVAASLQPDSTTASKELPIAPELYGGEKESVFPSVPFEVRFANLQKGISQLAAAGISSM